MNMWMKRGLQTALLTGGLMALGTGIAAADDSGITVTVEVTDSVLARTESAAAVSHENGGSAVDAEVPVTVTGNAVGVLGSGTAAGTPAPARPADDGGSLVDAD